MKSLGNSYLNHKGLTINILAVLAFLGINRTLGTGGVLEDLTFARTPWEKVERLFNFLILFFGILWAL